MVSREVRRRVRVNRWFAPLHALVIGGVLGSAVGCTTVLYDGPRRKPAEVSRLGTDSDTKLVSIDNRTTRGESLDVYEILPGAHKVVAAAKKGTSLDPGTQEPSKGLSLCFMAEPGKSYVASVAIRPPSVLFSINEKASGLSAGIACASSTDDGILTTPAVLNARSHPSATPNSEADEGSDSDVEDVPTGKLVRPLGGFRLGLGFAFGGDDLIKATMSNGETQTLSAGSGVEATLGATLTPLWIGNTAGLGFGASVGVKYNSVGGFISKVEVTRFPVELWAQTLLRLSPRWFFGFAAGAHKDYEVSLDSSGLASDFSTSLECPWGWMLNAGFQNMSSRYVGFGFGFHYVNLQYKLGGDSIDAQSFGIDVQLLLNP